MMTHLPMGAWGPGATSGPSQRGHPRQSLWDAGLHASLAGSDCECRSPRQRPGDPVGHAGPSCPQVG